jgi:hypothetical protein
LGLDRSSNSAFFFWASFAWYLKPLAGILTDAFPLFGSRRRSYILISATLAGLGWFGLIVTPHAYHAMLWVVIVINVFMVVTSTVVGGTMVEAAQAASASGRLTAIRQFVQQGCVIVNGPTAGYLASIAFGWTAGACGMIMLLLVPVTLIFLQEQRQTIDSTQLLANARHQLRNIASARTMWAAAGLMALFYAAPGFGTAIFYKQQNDLHLDTHAQGFLALIGGSFGVLAAIGYGILCRRLTLRTMLIGCIVLGTVANLGYLFYASFGQAQIVEGLNGFGRQRGSGFLVDGQRSQSCIVRDRLVWIDVAGPVPPVIRYAGDRQFRYHRHRRASGAAPAASFSGPARWRRRSARSTENGDGVTEARAFRWPEACQSGQNRPGCSREIPPRTHGLPAHRPVRNRHQGRCRRGSDKYQCIRFEQAPQEDRWHSEQRYQQNRICRR